MPIVKSNFYLSYRFLDYKYTIAVFGGVVVRASASLSVDLDSISSSSYTEDSCTV